MSSSHQGEAPKGLVTVSEIYSDAVVTEISIDMPDTPGPAASGTPDAKADHIAKLKAELMFWRDTERLTRDHMQDILTAGTMQAEVRALNEEAKEKQQRINQELVEAKREEANANPEAESSAQAKAKAKTKAKAKAVAQEIDPPGYYLPRLEDFYWGTGPGPRPGA